MTNQQIVVIEDEPAIADTLVHVIEQAGLSVSWCATAAQGLAVIQDEQVALVLLDVGLPDGNGFELCKQIRSFSTVPIIFLTARSDEIDRVVGLEIGADDYVTKPFSPREVLARIKLRMVRSDTPEPAAAQVSTDLHARQYDFYVGAQALQLTALEYKLLHKLHSHPRQVFSREQLMCAADMANASHYARNIDSHIKAIRHKLKSHDLAEVIHTKRGFGYFYEPK
ncbi:MULTISPECIES: response regulator [unclassified Pseudoalteromonas]|uniref:response regulator n=1 Tax=unclassified Pseudoalteromonas TaxID=194690 RepID=UPI000CF70BA1|nr:MULTISPECIES: response regulator [unclassified Pseudoalteromonas]